MSIASIKRLGSPEIAVAIVIAVLLGVITVATHTKNSALELISTGAASESSVTADALPTTQIDGVAWSQAVAGNTVFVGGKFQSARPAGSPAGSKEQVRKNLLSYDITTGVLTSWQPRLNAQARVVALSPNKKVLYVGGDFTLAAQKTRIRIAAFDVATGNLISAFAPQLDAAVKTIVATDYAVYVGGSFTTANGQPRTRLAAFSAADGSLYNWNPTANATVEAMTMTPDGKSLVVGGSFTKLGGKDAYGMGRVDGSSAKPLSWQANTVIRDAGLNGSITSLTTDGNLIFGTGFAFSNSKATFEGTFAAHPSDGSIAWIEDCHGDSYSAFQQNNVLYVASHAHDCERLAGFPQTAGAQRATAFTTTATQTLWPNLAPTYVSFQGNAAPSLLNWFPLLAEGTITGQHQAAWSVSGNDHYVVYAGEFPSVNNVPQAGLVRFANRGVAAGKMGPEKSGDNWKATATSLDPNKTRISFQPNWDRDDKTLSYGVVRQQIDPGTGAAAGPETLIYWFLGDSTFYSRTPLVFTDSAVSAGQVYDYRIQATDNNGNGSFSSRARVTVSGTASFNDYSNRVRGLGATNYYRFTESNGSSALDWAGGANAVVGSDVKRSVSGITGGSAYGFTGSDDSVITSVAGSYGPQTFTVQAWVQTTAKQSGEIIGFGDSNRTSELEPVSAINDRVLYMRADGSVVFGVYDGFPKKTAATSSPRINDGQWHQITGTFTWNSMKLYVDGALVDSNSNVFSAAIQYGYWRIGGDSVKLFNDLDKTVNFRGNIDDVAIYPTALSGDQVAGLYSLR